MHACTTGYGSQTNDVRECSDIITVIHTVILYSAAHDQPPEPVLVSWPACSAFMYIHYILELNSPVEQSQMNLLPVIQQCSTHKHTSISSRFNSCVDIQVTDD